MNRETEQKIIHYISDALEMLKSGSRLVSGEQPEIRLERPKDESHGDVSCNIAMRMSRTEKKPPMEIASMITGELAGQEIADAPFSRVEAVKPGFINFFLKPEVIRGFLSTALSAGGNYGSSDAGSGKRANVEFVSANPTGPLTVGHGRHAVMGDTIANILSMAGYEVAREYYFNNAGNQMSILGDSVRLRYLELLGDETPFPDTHYQGEYIREIAKMLYDEKGDSLRNAGVDPFKARAESVVFEDIRRTLERIGVTFDRYFNENSLYETGAVHATVSKLRGKGYGYDKDGAVWFKATEFGLPDDKVIIKSTGEPTYRLPDICYHIDKIERGYDRIIDIFGQDHHATVPEVQAGLKALGYSTEKIEVLLLQFVTLTRKGEVVKMSTRRANYVTLDELLEAVASEMQAELSKQQGTGTSRLAEPDFQRMASDAVRYFYIMRKANAHLEFDLDLAKSQSMENPVYYIQYAHARICSIFRKYRNDAGHGSIDFSGFGEKELEPLKEDKELSIIKLLARFPRIVEEVASSLETHRIHDYLGELASELQQYYTIHRVINPDNHPLTLARLSLIEGVRITIRNAIALLGISAPESM